MAPNAVTLAETANVQEKVISKPSPWKIAWNNVILLTLFHLMALHGFYLMVTGQCKLMTCIIGYLLDIYGCFGITAGAHRLWAHRTYKAKVPLRIFLMLANCKAFQGDIYKWSRDHRIHHKFTDTDADPYNAARGFFFSHVGWLLLRKHPKVLTKGQMTDCSDILADPVVRFQKKYYFPLAFFMSFFLPTYLPVWLLKETWWNSFFVSGIFMYILSLHSTWLVNSAAHMWGNRPYDLQISPRENVFVSLLAYGEGFHNYHHTFPWDYSTSELGFKWNVSTAFIDLMAKIGQAYDLRKATPAMVNMRKTRTAYILVAFGMLGVTAGVHRLWSHRSYKAKTPLRIFLMLGNCLAFQGTIYKWSRDHRVHHKYTDTDADPYNSTRGFFFSHMGWLMVRKHPEVTAKGQITDCSDLLADPVVRFQMKYYFPLAIFMAFIMPTYLTIWLYDEVWWKAFFIAGVGRYTLTLHLTWPVNSAAHMFGYRPYDQKISPRESPIVILLGFGEGFHNYHHTFPWDYFTGEWGMKWNLSTAFINLMAKIGQAYDLKSATSQIVEKRKLRTGIYS